MQKFKALPILAGAAALGAVALTGTLAYAAPITGTLNIANANLATQGSGPYASYTITGVTGNDSTGFTEFHVTASGLNGFVFGDSNVFNLNLSTTGTLCLNDMQSGCTTGAPSPTDLTQTAAGNADGFGSFNFSLNDGSGFSPNSVFSSLSLDFTTAAVTEENLLTSNGTATVAAHMALGSNLNCTGFAGNGGTQGMGTNDNPGNCSAVPAPVIGHGLLVLLAIGGVLGGGKLLENLKKQHRLRAA